jgi:hypothetical protein
MLPYFGIAATGSLVVACAIKVFNEVFKIEIITLKNVET